jgi:predicted enzyme related to lactoylglutathione lyase
VTACEPLEAPMPSFVTHFEIFAEDPAPLAEFYRRLFGWRVEQAWGSTIT